MKGRGGRAKQESNLKRVKGQTDADAEGRWWVVAGEKMIMSLSCINRGPTL